MLIDSEQRGAGSHELIWDARGLGSGVYLLRLGAGDEWISRKVLLVK